MANEISVLEIGKNLLEAYKTGLLDVIKNDIREEIFIAQVFDVDPESLPEYKKYSSLWQFLESDDFVKLADDRKIKLPFYIVEFYKGDWGWIFVDENGKLKIEYRDRIVNLDKLPSTVTEDSEDKIDLPKEIILPKSYIKKFGLKVYRSKYMPECVLEPAILEFEGTRYEGLLFYSSEFDKYFVIVNGRKSLYEVPHKYIISREYRW